MKQIRLKLTDVNLKTGPRYRHLMGKRTAQRATIKDITSDSQVNSYFPYRWSPGSLTFNIYFTYLLYLYITQITINNDTPHQKSPKNQNRRAALGRPAIKLVGGGGGGGLQLLCGRPTLVLSFARVKLCYTMLGSNEKFKMILFTMNNYWGDMIYERKGWYLL